MKILTSLCVAFVLCAGSAVQAATFKFTDEHRASTSSFTMESESGLELTVSGGAFKKGSKTVTTHKGYGLSVGRHLINRKEYVRLDFSHSVSLWGFLAGYVDKFDDYVVYGKGADGFEEIQTGDFGVSNRHGGNRNRALVKLWGDASDFVSTSFVISVADKWDEFKLRGLKVHEVAPVPLPAGAILLLSGLGFFAFRRRRTA